MYVFTEHKVLYPINRLAVYFRTSFLTIVLTAAAKR